MPVTLPFKIRAKHLSLLHVFAWCLSMSAIGTSTWHWVHELGLYGHSSSCLDIFCRCTSTLQPACWYRQFVSLNWHCGRWYSCSSTFPVHGDPSLMHLAASEDTRAATKTLTDATVIFSLQYGHTCPLAGPWFNLSTQAWQIVWQHCKLMGFIIKDVLGCQTNQTIKEHSLIFYLTTRFFLYAQWLMTLNFFCATRFWNGLSNYFEETLNMTQEVIQCKANRGPVHYAR